MTETKLETPYSHVLVVNFMFWQRNLRVFLQMSSDPRYCELNLSSASEGIDRSARVNQTQGSIFLAMKISMSLLSEWITLHVSWRELEVEEQPFEFVQSLDGVHHLGDLWLRGITEKRERSRFSTSVNYECSVKGFPEQAALKFGLYTSRRRKKFYTN